MPFFTGAQYFNTSGTFNDVGGHQTNVIMNIHSNTNQLQGNTAEAQGFRLSTVPPPAPVVFYGRDEFIAQAVFLIQTSQPARLSILGAGGIGKTSVALTILHHPQVQELFQNRCYFVSCEAVTDASHLLNNILHVLGVEHTPGGDYLAALHGFFMLSHSLLIVLDNFETPWEESDSQADVGTVLQSLAAAKHLTLIITMRGNFSPSGVDWTQPDTLPALSPLSMGAAHQAFIAVNPKAGNAQSKKDLDLLLQEMDCVPLAVMLMAQLGKSQTCSSLLRCWKKEKTGFIKTQSGAKAGRLTSIDISISISMHSSIVLGEEPEATQFMALVSHLPDGVVNWETSLDEITPDFKAAGSVVSALLRTALVYVDSGGTLKMLSPVQHYVATKHTAQNTHLMALVNYYIGLVNKHGQSLDNGIMAPFALQTLFPHIGNISSIFKYAIQSHPSQDLVDAIFVISDFLLEFHPSCVLLIELLPKLEILDMKHMEAHIHRVIGQNFGKQRKFQEARQSIETAQNIFSLNGDTQGTAECLQSLGHILLLESRKLEAQQLIQRAHTKFSEIGCVIGMAECLQNLGNIACEDGKWVKAREKLEKAQAQFTQLGNLRKAAQCQWSLGEVLFHESKYTEAKKIISTAYTQLVQLGDMKFGAQCLWSLGQILKKEKDYPQAKLELERAYNIFTEVRDHLGAAQALHTLGEIWRLEDNYEVAKAKLKESQTLFLQVRNQLGNAQCMWSLGHIMMHENQPAEAKVFVENALVQFNLIEDKKTRVHCFDTLGDICFQARKFEEAKEKYQVAYTEFKSMGQAEEANFCLWKIGETLRLNSNFKEARAIQESVFEKASENGCKLEMALSLWAMGEIFLAEGENDKAEEKLEVALGLFVHLGNQRGISYCMQSLAKLK